MGRAGRPTVAIELTDEERETLVRGSRRHSSSQALALRSRIVLACAGGGPNTKIADELGCDRVTVCKWRHRFAAEIARTAVTWLVTGYVLYRHFMILPFRAHGHDGRIQVAYETKGDPETIGSALVGAVNYDPETFRGFPTMMVSVDYEGTGYRGTFGWIQVINCRDVDLPPFLADVDSPFCAFGHLPSLFDAPANPEHPDGPWVAETFLVTSPDIARTRQLMPVVGFQWGYELAGGRPTSFLPSEIGPERWDAVREFLGTQFDSWTFLDWPQ